MGSFFRYFLAFPMFYIYSQCIPKSQCIIPSTLFPSPLAPFPSKRKEKEKKERKERKEKKEKKEKKRFSVSQCIRYVLYLFYPLQSKYPSVGTNLHPGMYSLTKLVVLFLK